MKKMIALAIALFACSALAQQVTTPMQVDTAGRLVVPNKSAWQDANGMAARDRDNAFTGANTFQGAPVPATLSRLPSVAEKTQTVTLRGDATVSITDAKGTALAEKALVRVWISTTDGGAPDDTDNTVTTSGGTVIEAVEADAHYLLLTGATGAVEVRVTVAGAGDRYVMVECGGRVASAKLEIAVIE